MPYQDLIKNIMMKKPSNKMELSPLLKKAMPLHHKFKKKLLKKKHQLLEKNQVLPSNPIIV